jgi:hypothetical protein
VRLAWLSGLRLLSLRPKDAVHAATPFNPAGYMLAMD